MAKIGTAHVEIKPVLNEEALNAICVEVERRVTEAVQRGMAGRLPYPFQQIPVPPLIWSTTCANTTHTFTIEPGDPVDIAKEAARIADFTGI